MRLTKPVINIINVMDVIKVLLSGLIPCGLLPQGFFYFFITLTTKERNYLFIRGNPAFYYHAENVSGEP